MPDEQSDQRRIHIGLALIAVSVVVALVVMVLVDSPLGRLAMAAIIAVALFRGWRLYRTVGTTPQD